MKIIKADVNDEIIFNTIEDIDTGITTGITSVLRLPTGNLNNILIDFNFINKKLPQELRILANFNINEKRCIDVELRKITVGERTFENACYIPAEVFEEPCYFMLGLYGFALDEEDALKQRISLIPLKNIVIKGSYEPDAVETVIPTPTAFEVYFNEVAEVGKEFEAKYTEYDAKIEEKFIETNELLNEKVLFHKKYEEVYVAVEDNQNIIPIENYIEPTMVFVNIEGLSLNEKYFYLDKENKNIVLTEGIDVGTEVHIVMIKTVVANENDYEMLKGDKGDKGDKGEDGTVAEKPKAFLNAVVENGSQLEQCGNFPIKRFNKLMGNTEQESREGYNLTKIPETLTKEGVTLTKYADGSFDLIGTATADSSFNVNMPINEIELGKKYTLYTNQNISLRRQVAIYNKNIWVSTPINQLENDTSKIFTALIPDTQAVATDYRFFINIATGITYNLKNVKIMLLKGEYTEDTMPPFEQYGAMPSINYPSPIKVVEGSFESYNICNAPYTKDNKLTITATKDDYYEFPDYYAEMEAGKTYTLSFESDGTYGLNSGTDTIQVFWLLNKEYTTQYQMTGFKNTFTPTVSGKYYLRCDVNKNGTTHGFWNFMVYEGKEDKPYLPYGTIKNTYETKIENKNLFNFNEITTKGNSGVTAILQDNGFTMRGTSTWGNYYIYLKNPNKNSDISFSADFLETAIASKKGMTIYGNNVMSSSGLTTLKALYENVNLDAKTRIGVTVNSGDYEYIMIRVWNNATSTALTKESNCIVDNIQFELGNTATDYVEHQEQVKNLDFPEGIQLAKEDELQFNYTEKNGYKTIDRDSVYYVKNYSKIVITENENISYDSTYKYFRVPNYDFKGFIPHSDTTLKQYSNMLKQETNWTKFRDGINIDSLFYSVHSTSYKINFRVLDFDNVNDLKSYLAEHTLYFMYKLATPIKTQITDETFISQLEDLLNIQIYEGQTNFSINGDSVSFKMDLDYWTWYKGESGSVDVPTKVSDLENDLSFVTKKQLNEALDTKYTELYSNSSMSNTTGTLSEAYTNFQEIMVIFGSHTDERQIMTIPTEYINTDHTAQKFYANFSFQSYDRRVYIIFDTETTFTKKSNSDSEYGIRKIYGIGRKTGGEE